MRRALRSRLPPLPLLPYPSDDLARLNRRQARAQRVHPGRGFAPHGDARPLPDGGVDGPAAGTARQPLDDTPGVIVHHDIDPSSYFVRLQRCLGECVKITHRPPSWRSTPVLANRTFAATGSLVLVWAAHLLAGLSPESHPGEPNMKSSRSALPLALALFAPLVVTPLTAPPTRAQSPETISAALGDIEWRHIGPVNMGGRVSAIIGVPGDPRTFWVGGSQRGRLEDHQRRRDVRAPVGQREHLLGRGADARPLRPQRTLARCRRGGSAQLRLVRRRGVPLDRRRRHLDPPRPR